jgi:hypothetical protein
VLVSGRSSFTEISVLGLFICFHGARNLGITVHGAVIQLGLVMMLTLRAYGIHFGINWVFFFLKAYFSFYA